MCWDFEAEFTAELSSPAAARAAVAEAIATRFHVDPAAPIISDARLVVSELVTSAVRNGARSVEVHAQLHHGELWLEVLQVRGPENDSAIASAERPVVDIGEGRGALLIAALATIRGETQATRGTVVWAMLETAPSLTSSMGCELAPPSAILAFAS